MRNPDAVKKVLRTYFSEEELTKTSSTAQYEKLKTDLTNKNLCEKGNEEYLGITLRNNYREFLKKYVFCYPYRRDFLVIKYFTRTCKLTKTRLFPKCEFGEDNTPEHAANSCTEKMNEEERKTHTKEFKNLFEEAMIDVGEDKQLSNYLFWTMFKVEDNRQKSPKIRQMIDKMKTVITKLLIKSEERNEYTKYDEFFKYSLFYTLLVTYLIYNIFSLT